MPLPVQPRRYRFAGFLLEPDQQRLSGPDGRINLPPKAFDALCLLVGEAGSLVTREKLQERLWPGGGIVADATLSKLIWQVRHALGDDGETFIQTVPRKGYRFVARLVSADPSPGTDAQAEARVPEPAAATASPGPARPQSPPKAARSIGLIAALCLLLVVLAVTQRWSAEDSDPSRTEAQLLAVRASAMLDRRSQDEVAEAVRLYRQAVELAPDSADMQAGLAVAISLISGVGLPASSYDSARQHAELALQLQPGHPEALAVLGLVAMNRDRDWPAAEARFRQALTAAPDHVHAHHWLGELLVLLGERSEEGLAHLERAHQLQPGSAAVASDLAKAAYFARRFEQAVALADQVLQAEPGFPHTHRWRGLARAELGQCEAAIGDLRDAVALDRNPVVRGEQIYVLGRCGNVEPAARLLAELELEATHGYISPIALMLGRIGSGDTGGALDALEQSVQTGNMVLGFATAPQLDALRAEPRGQRILAQLRESSTK